MKRILISLLCLLVGMNFAVANDGIYFTQGNFLIPLQETEISAQKEILTITIGRDSFATVNVHYEFMNGGNAKTVKMAFEAEPQYNAPSNRVNRNGIHPYIKDFTVKMNGKALPHSNALVAFHGRTDRIENCDFTPLDTTKWKAYGEVADSLLPAETILYNPETDSTVSFAYAYYFNAPFKEGLNIVDHTYRYHMNSNVMEDFDIPYWLTPVTRWANGQVDDFTLNIKAEENTEFCIAGIEDDSLFNAAPFVSAKGTTIYKLAASDHVFYFSTLSEDDVVSWHCKNFRPAHNMDISSPTWSDNSVWSKTKTNDCVVIEKDGTKTRYLADCGDSYFISAQDYGFVKKKDSRIVEYSATNGQGIIVIDSDSAKVVNIRQRPTTKSRIIATISDRDGELPDVLPCKGLVQGNDGYFWFKTRINGKNGYIRQDLMQWDAIDTY